MVRLKDVADRAGVSISVVSRALNPNPDGNARVADETREHIAAVALEMGYRPNRAAEFLKRGAAPIIGVFIYHRADSLMANFVMGIGEAAAEAGFPFSLSHGRNYESYKKFISGVSDATHCGIITYPFLNLKPEITEVIEGFIERGGKLVQVEAETGFSGAPAVVVDDDLGGRIAADHLHEKGCDRYITIGIFPERMNGFIRRLGELGIESEVVYDNDKGLKAVRKLCRKGIRLGVFCAADYLAMGVFSMLSGTQYKIGRDVLVIGYDDQALARQMSPPLTTVFQPWDEMGRVAVRTVVDMIYGKEVIDSVVKPKLIARGSA